MCIDTSMSVILFCVSFELCICLKITNIMYLSNSYIYSLNSHYSKPLIKSVSTHTHAAQTFQTQVMIYLQTIQPSGIIMKYNVTDIFRDLLLLRMNANNIAVSKY